MVLEDRDGPDGVQPGQKQHVSNSHTLARDQLEGHTADSRMTEQTIKWPKWALLAQKTEQELNLAQAPRTMTKHEPNMPKPGKA